ncbi:hypothetical protein PENANT_c001G05189 [Penicillium antarcticum]|uniref:Uncharacterized protein n=1 Tax=Penicillium antarcticum TaxID=416450 RepID=A0A1V6QNZ6_9EURO|nr:hypothetical protein PENANT_c001G05189 [Penicillium antarcticum]
MPLFLFWKTVRQAVPTRCAEAADYWNVSEDLMVGMSIYIL